MFVALREYQLHKVIESVLWPSADGLNMRPLNACPDTGEEGAMSALALIAFLAINGSWWCF